MTCSVSDDVQCLGRDDEITESAQLFPRVLEHIPIPLELIAKHAVGLRHYRVRDVDTNDSSPRVADDQCCAGPPKCSALI